MNTTNRYHRSILQGIARRAMLERGLLPDFSNAALAELARLQTRAGTLDSPAEGPDGIHDMRSALWASIDNNDSRDLDQLTVAEEMEHGNVKILVAIADVDSFVKKGSALDEHAGHNTTSVYTAAEIFPMLPEKISTDLTSLNFDQDRLSVVIEMLVDPDGVIQDSRIYRARVRNHAKLAYNSVAAWLENREVVPDAIAAVEGLAENLELQDQAAQRMKDLRHEQGAL
ncbi:MAG TPA: RNB domain-containing ribonuclease, partial [Anaerolineales bacterium]